MDTKPCRHCKQPIHKDARRCQHCLSAQSWMADHKDPRYLFVTLAAIIVIMAIFVGFMNLMPDMLTGGQGEPPVLAVSEVEYVFGTGSVSDRIFVMGELTNETGTDAAAPVLRTNLWNNGGKLLDSFLDEARRLVVPAHGKARFRVDALTPVTPSDIGRIEVLVERNRARNRFD
jgi:hypothetical protein